MKGYNKGDLGFMVQKVIKCGFIGGIILFIWSAVSWTILPWQMNQFKKFADEKDVRFTIKDNALESGLYMIPSIDHKTTDEVMEAKKQMAEGPYVFAAIRAEGRNPNMSGNAVAGLIIEIIAASLVAWLLFHTKLDFNRSVLFVTVIGFILGMSSSMPYVIWFGFPGVFAIAWIIQAILGWFFAGLAMAKIANKK